MLIVMQHRLVEPLLQLALDLETLRCSKILELNRTERHFDRRDSLDHAIRLGLAQQDWHTGDSDKVGKQRGLAFHDRQAGQSADISQTENRRAVRHDGDSIVDGSKIARCPGIALDRQAHSRDSGRIDVAQHLLRIDRNARNRADLSPAVAVEHTIGLPEKARGRQLRNALVEAPVSLFVHL